MTRRELWKCAGLLPGAAALLGARGALQEPLIVHHEEHALAVESGRGFAEIIELRAKSRPPDLVAGLRDLTPSQASKWANHVRQGRWMLIENGLGFAAPEQSASQRALLFNAFGLLTGPAIPASQLDAIYVEYRWPVRRMVRHFGAVTPVSGGQVIATIGGIPVACRLFARACGRRHLSGNSARAAAGVARSGSPRPCRGFCARAQRLASKRCASAILRTESAIAPRFHHRCLPERSRVHPTVPQLRVSPDGAVRSRHRERVELRWHSADPAGESPGDSVD